MMAPHKQELRKRAVMEINIHEVLIQPLCVTADGMTGQAIGAMMSWNTTPKTPLVPPTKPDANPISIESMQTTVK